MSEALARGETHDATGQKLSLPKDHGPVEYDGDMAFWLHLDAELAGARSESGLLNPQAIEWALDRWGIGHPLNRETAHRMLRELAIGRNEALAEDMQEQRAKAQQQSRKHNRGRR